MDAHLFGHDQGLYKRRIHRVFGQQLGGTLVGDVPNLFFGVGFVVLLEAIDAECIGEVDITENG